MRVISGLAKGRKLVAPPGLSIRPTADRTKETIFNILAANIGGSAFLDLFSGTGAIGIEALSRGAAKAVFVENSEGSTQVIWQNIRHTKLEAGARVLHMHFADAIKQLKEENYLFDIIFMDPPYARHFIADALDATLRLGILSEGGCVVIEQSAKEPLPVCEELSLVFGKRYKTTALFVLRKMEGTI